MTRSRTSLPFSRPAPCPATYPRLVPCPRPAPCCRSILYPRPVLHLVLSLLFILANFALPNFVLTIGVYSYGSHPAPCLRHAPCPRCALVLASSCPDPDPCPRPITFPRLALCPRESLPYSLSLPALDEDKEQGESK